MQHKAPMQAYLLEPTIRASRQITIFKIVTPLKVPASRHRCRGRQGRPRVRGWQYAAAEPQLKAAQSLMLELQDTCMVLMDQHKQAY